MKIKSIVLSITLFTILLIVTRCHNSGENNVHNKENSGTLSIMAYNVKESNGVSLIVIDENNRALVEEQTFGDNIRANSDGSYTRTLTGLNDSHTYTVMLLSDVNGSDNVDADDTGQIISSISPGGSVLFTNIEKLAIITVSTIVDTSKANKKCWGFINIFDYTIDDFPVLPERGVLGFLWFPYDADGKNEVKMKAFLPKGAYGKIFCFIDMNSNNALDPGDCYQFGSEPIIINTPGSVHTIVLGSWLTY